MIGVGRSAPVAPPQVADRGRCRVRALNGVDPYAQHIRLWQLVHLAKSQRNGGEDTVDTYYGWREARALTVATGMGAAALSVLTAWLVPFLKDEYKGSPLWMNVLLPICLVLALATIGLVSLLRMDAIHGSYVRAVVWLQRLR